MIDIFCTGASFYGVKLSYAAMEIIMREDFVKDQDFIEFVFEDGTKGAIRKGTVIGFAESTVEVGPVKKEQRESQRRSHIYL